MRISKFTCCLLFIAAIIFGQSSIEYRRHNIMNRNQVTTVFGNWGVIGQPLNNEARGAWKHPENGYIGDFSIMIGTQLKTNSFEFSSVEICPVSRPTTQNELSPTGRFWGFEPFGLGSEHIAMSDNPVTWPSEWGTWPFDTEGATECYFIMDDNNDEEFNYELNNIWSAAFKPDSNDLARNGLGLKVESRFRQFDFAGFEDVLFMEYMITNEGTTPFHQLVFGGLNGTYIGITSTDHSAHEYDDDACFFDISTNATYFWDFNMDVSDNPLWKGDVGYASIVLLQTPGNPFDGIDNDRDNANVSGSSAPYFTESDFDERMINTNDQIVLIDDNYTRTVVTVPGQELTVETCGETFTIVPGATVVQEGNPDSETSYDGIDNDFDGLIDENYTLHYSFDRAHLVEPFHIQNTLEPTQYVDYISGQGLDDPLIDENGNNLDEVGLTSFYYFVSPMYIPLGDDEELWSRMRPGYFELSDSYSDGHLLNGEDGDYLFGSGYFHLNPDEQQKVLLGLVFADTPEEMQMKIQALNAMNFNIQAEPNLILTAPESGEYSGNFLDISWNSNEPEGEIIIKYTNDNERTWNIVDVLPASESNYVWDIRNQHDGIFYKILLHHSYQPFKVSSSNLFTMNTSNEAVPQIMFTDVPGHEEIVTGDLSVSWLAGDADGDEISIKMVYSTTHSISDTVWHELASFSSSGGYTINTVQLPNSQSALLKLAVTDGNKTNSEISEPFIISNDTPDLPANLKSHITGKGSGQFEVRVVDNSALNGHPYKVTFHVDGMSKSYSVQDLNTAEYVLSNCTQLDSSAESPTFDGVRLLVHDINPAQPDDEGSCWSDSLKAYNFYMNPLDTWINSDHLLGIPQPSDYRVEFADGIIDSSLAIPEYSVESIPVNFRIYNITAARFTDFIFVDIDNSQTLSPYDELILVESVSDGEILFSWDLFFTNETIYTHGNGDTLFIKTLKPFTAEDCFIFTTGDSLMLDVNKENNSPGVFNLSQNYPNPFNPSTTIQYTLPERMNVKLIVYNMLGKEVITLVDEKQTAGFYEMPWDGRNKLGNQVSSGIYFCKVQAGQYNAIKKMIFLK